MKRNITINLGVLLALSLSVSVSRVEGAAAPDKLVDIHSSRVMSQSLGGDSEMTRN